MTALPNKYYNEHHSAIEEGTAKKYLKERAGKCRQRQLREMESNDSTRHS